MDIDKDFDKEITPILHDLANVVIGMSMKEAKRVIKQFIRDKLKEVEKEERLKHQEIHAKQEQHNDTIFAEYETKLKEVVNGKLEKILNETKRISTGWDQAIIQKRIQEEMI